MLWFFSSCYRQFVRDITRQLWNILQISSEYLRAHCFKSSKSTDCILITLLLSNLICNSFPLTINVWNGHFLVCCYVYILLPQIFSLSFFIPQNSGFRAIIPTQMCSIEIFISTSPIIIHKDYSLWHPNIIQILNCIANMHVLFIAIIKCYKLNEL